jgi:Na+-driven multidrug efflux pump
MLFEIFSRVIFNLADTFFVGRLGKEQLAALNALSSVMGPFIGQNIGAKQLERVKAGFTTSGRFSFSVGGFLFCIYLIFAPKVAAIFNADPIVISTAALYLRIVSLA